MQISSVRIHRRVASSLLFRNFAVPSFASVDPVTMSASTPHTVFNLVDGKWSRTEKYTEIVDPLNGEKFLNVPDTKEKELELFVRSAKLCPKSGLHNPFKNVQRYLLYGDVSARAAARLREPVVENFFTKLIQRVAPKSDVQARGEVTIVRLFLENFSGDQVRFLSRSFAVPGDHDGQTTHGYRFPFGNTALIAPFNFPLEIPMLQLMGALYMGNKVTFKSDSKNSIVMEQAVRLLHECGMPKEDADFINCDGPVMHRFLLESKPRMTLFTGSAKVAEILARDLHGRIKIEDAGFDWKILGPDVNDIDMVAAVSDQDAYAYSGQKCSAQSMLFVHENWAKAGFVNKIKALAARRNLNDLTVGPILTVTNQTYQQHVNQLLSIPGASIAFGGRLLENHSIPSCYGSWEPTAIYVPIEEMLKEQNFPIVTREIFGPFQVITEYADHQLNLVLEACERMEAHLTAAIVSNDVQFRRKVLGNTVNGTTYCGLRARTTGAPQNHWFGPANDPRAAGIGTPEAIKVVWSCHREVIIDEARAPSNYQIPNAT